MFCVLADAVLSVVGHLSPVVSIEPVLATADTSLKSTLTADIDGNVFNIFFFLNKLNALQFKTWGQ